MEEKEKVETEVVEQTFDNLEFESIDGGNIYDDIYFVKIKTKDAAYFQFSKKDGDKMLIDPRKTIRNIDGRVTKIELGSYTYEGKEIKTFKINLSKELNGKNVLFILNSSFTQVGRSIINSLLGETEPIQKLNLSLYRNKNGYASVKTIINDHKSMWKYSIDEQRKKIETIKDKKGNFVSNVYTELDEFLEEKLRMHIGILLPEMEGPKIVEDVDDKNTKDESVFGEEEDDASDFFEIDSN